MRIDILTVFPEMFRGFLGESILSRAGRAGKVFIRTVDLRDFARDRRRTVDDKPYSGGPGMLLKADVWIDAIETVRTPGCRVIMTSPSGVAYTQRKAEEYSSCDHLIFLCGHYEGFDERIRTLVTDEISMGDFVLTGGEIPVAAMIDSIVRLLPGVLGGGAEATANESFGADGMLEAPQYTRPPEFRGMRVPEILMNGDHAKVAAWRKRQAIDLTTRRRPDLIEMGGTFAIGENP
ncbi:MAG: tRNA (guanosine(37)-N1)-methyltransferase TrmD [Kiritimatiellae bacterium]|nr:tRNA (guanosine(37)-N1)-methyltransferase TrmD [Kiritimatiellia bacterium]